MKYYTPEIEEFHIGFEYEWLDDEKEDPTWIKATTPTAIEIKGYEDIVYGLRVKYLDREDIEELGFIELGQEDYYLHGDLNNLRIEKLHHKDIPCFYRINYDNEDIGSTNLFVSIKNKSELKRLMKQLGL